MTWCGCNTSRHGWPRWGVLQDKPWNGVYQDIQRNRGGNRARTADRKACCLMFEAFLWSSRHCSDHTREGLATFRWSPWPATQKDSQKWHWSGQRELWAWSHELGLVMLNHHQHVLVQSRDLKSVDIDRHDNMTKIRMELRRTSWRKSRHKNENMSGTAPAVRGIPQPKTGR